MTRDEKVAKIIGTEAPAQDIAFRRLNDVQNGTVAIPYRCGWCDHTGVMNHQDIPDALLCLACGKATKKTSAAAERVRRIRIYVETGIA